MAPLENAFMFYYVCEQILVLQLKKNTKRGMFPLRAPRATALSPSQTVLIKKSYIDAGFLASSILWLLSFPQHVCWRIISSTEEAR